jgi:hypothetical protein
LCQVLDEFQRQVQRRVLSSEAQRAQKLRMDRLRAAGVASTLSAETKRASSTSGGGKDEDGSSATRVPELSPKSGGARKRSGSSSDAGGKGGADSGESSEPDLSALLREGPLRPAALAGSPEQVERVMPTFRVMCKIWTAAMRAAGEYVIVSAEKPLR